VLGTTLLKLNVLHRALAETCASCGTLLHLGIHNFAINKSAVRQVTFAELAICHTGIGSLDIVNDAADNELHGLHLNVIHATCRIVPSNELAIPESAFCNVAVSQLP
jgi:hypothetical protein